MILDPVVTLTNPSASFARAWTATPMQYMAPTLISGPMTDTQPATGEPQAVVAGQLMPDFFDEFYHRIHIKPAWIDLGNVISNVTRQVEVWNAHFDARLLAAITPAGTIGGVTLAGQPAPPLTYGPLQSRLYTLTVSTAGDPIIDAAYAFSFGIEQPTLKVTGRRIVVWSLRPDWSSGITERLEWLTDVLAAYDGTEQRIRLRENARRSLEMAFLLDGRAAGIADTLLSGWSGRKYCVPVWMERDVLASSVAAGATAITVTDAALKDYRVGGYVMLWRDETLAEAVEIDAITGNTLALKVPVAASYPAGSSVCPVMIARIDGEARTGRVTGRILRGRVRFIDEQAADRAPAEIGPMWQGHAVLDERPDRSEDVDESWARSLEVLDNLTGVVTVDDTTQQPIIRRTYTWLLNGRAAIDRWKKWASARAGLYTALWLPTFGEDVEVVDTIGEAETSIKVVNTLSARYAMGTPGRVALRIESIAGQVYHRRVIGITELDAQTEAIGIDSALGVTVSPNDIRRIMWMGLARLESDALEIHYETDSVARIQVTFRMVRQ